MLLLQSKKIAAILLGTFLVAAAYYVFQKPNGITAPGLGGIAVIVANVLHSPLGLIYFVLNIPIFLIGYRSIGSSFAFFSLIGMGALSLFLAILSTIPTLPSPIVGCILGGVLSGIGIGIVIQAGATTGGLDIASVVIAKHFPFITIGKTMMVVNGFVLFLTFLTDGFDHTVLTFISIIIAGKSVDSSISLIQRYKNEEASL
ncbi:YitT family protein [Neobacillus sp. OS1-2]|uniref:YitT family protein n=1 Tax=Neobacillus sp. OS1-2 TaxID=3070680 RepID=UPI0027DF8339|nr:YitT family protein [Neobacillus sp. OS1-2]WML41503.1 YitT family protein [Neobacillus sp. OS1-2]